MTLAARTLTQARSGADRRPSFQRSSKATDALRRPFCVFRAARMGSLCTELMPVIAVKMRRGGKGFDVAAHDVELGSFGRGFNAEERQLDLGGIGKDWIFEEQLIFAAPDILALQAAELGDGAALAGLMHLFIAIDPVKLEAEFVVEQGVEESFIECVVLDLLFEGVAAADIPGGMENDVEEFILDDTGGLEFSE